MWVNKDKQIIYIAPLENVEIKYACIASVNGDTNKNNTYSINYIDRLTLFNDNTKYNVSNEATLKYNGEMTNVSVKLIDNYAKIVMQNDAIIFIESWDLKEGGIIEKITDDEITYIDYRKWNNGETINTLHKFTDEEKAYDVHYDLQQQR